MVGALLVQVVGATRALVLPLELLAVAALVVLAVVMLRPASARAIGRWADAHEVTVTPRTEPLVARYLTRARRWRAAGALAGVILPAVTAIAGSPRPGFWQAVLIGYLAGAALAELTRPDPAGATRAAALVPRRLDDYVPRSATLWLRTRAALSLVATTLRFVGPIDATWRNRAPSASAFVVATIACVVVAVVAEGAARRIVARPQRYEAADLLAADDAIRSASAHAVIGAALALVLLVVGNQLFQVGTATEPQLLRWTLPLIGAACTLGSLGAWFSTAHPRRSRVARPVTGAVVP